MTFLFAFVVTFAALGLAFAAMALGVFAGRGPMSRGCVSLGGACEACERPCRRAPSRDRRDRGARGERRAPGEEGEAAAR
jgi:hypothetical protein